MTKWDYNTIDILNYAIDTEDSIDKMLLAFGKDGWELVTIYKNDWFIFKKPIEEADK